MKKRGHIYLSLVLAFLIGNYRGYIALWTGGGEKPTEIYPYSVASLPLADQAALEKGIVINTQEELNRLLEDYLS